MKTARDNTVLVVAGPTASGKSALAMALAEACDGVVINADSMQVYRELRIVTARPDAADVERVPHRLYGCVAASNAYSVGDWLSMVAPVIEETWASGRIPVVTGGTGMYLKSLIEGIAEIPAVPPDMRTQVQDLFDKIGGDAFRERLRAVDPLAADRLVASDRQRLVRAMEVYEATGRTLNDWHSDGNTPVLADARYVKIVIEPSRDILYADIDRRFETMVEEGALDEVRAFMRFGLDPALPASKAVGVRELGDYLSGSATLGVAIAAAQQASRNYAKRQLTWIRNQIQKDFSLTTQYSESENEKIFSFIRQIGLTLPN